MIFSLSEMGGFFWNKYWFVSRFPYTGFGASSFMLELYTDIYVIILMGKSLTAMHFRCWEKLVGDLRIPI